MLQKLKAFNSLWKINEWSCVGFFAARETIKEKSFNWLQTSPQILPHQRMFTIMLEPSPGTQKKSGAASTMRITFFCCCEGYYGDGQNTRGCDAGTTTNSAVGIKKPISGDSFFKAYWISRSVSAFLFALLVPFSRRIELRDDWGIIGEEKALLPLLVFSCFAREAVFSIGKKNSSRE